MSTVVSLSIAIQARIPVLAWGPPGVGKTATITAVAEALGLPVEVVIASVREPSDFAGLPVIRDDGVRMEPPAWARRLAAAGRGIVFFDEVSTAPPAVQAALLRVVLDRVVGDLALPSGVAIVAAANPPEQAAGGWDLSPPGLVARRPDLGRRHVTRLADSRRPASAGWLAGGHPGLPGAGGILHPAPSAFVAPGTGQ